MLLKPRALLLSSLSMLPNRLSEPLSHSCCWSRGWHACFQAHHKVVQQVMREPHSCMLLPLGIQHLQKTALSGLSQRQQSQAHSNPLPHLRSEEAQMLMCFDVWHR